MVRVSFDTIFEIIDDNTLELKTSIRVGGISVFINMEAKPIQFVNGAYLGGVDFNLFRNRDLGVETDGDVFVIKGIY